MPYFIPEDLSEHTSMLQTTWISVNDQLIYGWLHSSTVNLVQWNIGKTLVYGYFVSETKENKRKA